MRTTKNAFIALTGFALLMLVLGATPALAQAPQPQQPAPAPAPVPAPAPAAQAEKAKALAPIEGDLVEVDVDDKKIEVKLADGTEVEFLYTDATEVTGAKGGPAGLVTMKDGRVTVHFTEDAAKTKTATRIIIQPKK